MGRGAAVLLAAALATGAALSGPSGTAAAATDPSPQPVRWSPALGDGETAGVEVRGGTARPAADRVRSAAARPDGHGDHRAPGLLTLPARRLEAPVDRVEAAVEGTGVAVDIRGLYDGRWTEWLPATPEPGPRTLAATLPGPATEVQARLVLDPTSGAGVRGLALTAYPARAAAPKPPKAAERHRVFATREGLVGGTTANGHVITTNDLFVALPSRRALSPRDRSDYSVEVCTASGRCAFAPVWDVGPWNTRDDHWNPSDHRENWRDLARGLPQAQAAKEKGHNGGKDQFGRTVLNPAGIDLADGLFRDALGLTDNAWVTVDYLWTGDSPLATVRVDGRVDLRGAPRPGARIVGLVGNGAAVPLQCRAGEWLRIGVGQFLPIAAVPRAPIHLPTCGG